MPLHNRAARDGKPRAAGCMTVEQGKEDQVPAILRKAQDAKWEKVGSFFDIADEALPGVKALKDVQVSMLFDQPAEMYFFNNMFTGGYPAVTWSGR